MPFILLGLAITLTLLSGVLHGRLTQRWSSADQFQQAAQALEQFPTTFGDWTREETLPLGESAIDLLQCHGYLHHVYRNRQTDHEVRVAVMVGPGSRMSIHVPEICFESANYSLVAPRERIDIVQDNRFDHFWRVRFRLNDVSQQPLDVLYAWSKGQTWLAPKFPRWSVAGTPILYKLQLSTIGSADATVVDDSASEFLKAFLPVLRNRLASVSP
jgi:hypothetical protein